MALRATLDGDLAQHVIAPIERMADEPERPCRKDASSLSINPLTKDLEFRRLGLVMGAAECYAGLMTYLDGGGLTAAGRARSERRLT
jgi:hypothetical protein